MMDWTRSGWVVSVALIHLLPGILMLLGVTLFLFLGALSVAAALAFGKGEAAVGIGLVTGILGLVPLAFALPFTCVGIGVLRRRAWARLLAIYLGGGLAGTGLLLVAVEGNLLGVLPLGHGAFTLGILLLPRFAAEFAAPR